MASFAGFEMPMWYEGIKAEHLSVRASAGLFDLSHMGEIFVEGREAFDLVQYLTCNDLRRIGDGQCQYTLLPTPEGGVVDDFIAYQFNPESYMLVVNASNIEKDFEWIKEHNKFDCIVTNRSDEYSLVAVQGPKTNDVLSTFGFKRVAAQVPFSFRRVKLDKRPIILAGTGYTGERGFEIIVENKDAAWLWDGLMALKDQFGMVPVGLGARDTLRLEMAYSLYGHELSDDISVLEANLGWTVRLGPDFIGKEILAKQKKNGVKRLVVGFTVDENRGAPRHAAPVFNEEGAEIGIVTSGSYSPSLDKGIALALLEPGYNEPGKRIAVEIRGARVNASIVELPFYSTKK